MYQSIRFLTIATLLFLLITNNSLAFAQVIDGPIARNYMKRQVRDLLYQQNFSDLEKIAQDFRTTKAKFPDGAWKLACFYQAFNSPKNSNDEGWKRFLSLFDRWMAKYPDSITARCAAAEGWEWFGWSARGTGYKVSKEGWPLFEKRLLMAHSFISEKPKRASDDCPERYDLLLKFAIYQNLDRDQFEALFHEAVSFQPDYFYFYLDKAHYLLPRWHGQDGDVIRFALETTKLSQEYGGKTLYANIVIQNWDNEFKSFADDGISWDLVKQGLIEIRRQYPSSPWILNNACKLACAAGDREMARELFKEIGDHPYIEAWSDLFRIGEYMKWKDWAFGNDTQKEQPQMRVFPGGTEDFREMMALAKEGDVEAQNKVGDMLYAGELAERNVAEATKWFLKAAEHGHREAQMMLGTLYSSGSNLPASRFEEAARWYYIAALQGDSNAASSLGRMNYNELGVYGTEKNLVQAYAWYGQITQWKDTKAKEIGAKLPPEQLRLAEEETKRLREEIRATTAAAEIQPLDTHTINFPKMTFNVVPIEIIPEVKLPTGNLLEGIKWETAGGAKADGKSLSILNGGTLKTLIKTGPMPRGTMHDICILVGARVRHSRPQAIVSGAPFFMGNLIFKGKQGRPIGTGLMVAPTVKEKNGPWFKVQKINSQFDAIDIVFGVAGRQEDEKIGSSTDFSNVKVMIFPTCEEANSAGASI